MSARRTTQALIVAFLVLLIPVAAHAVAPPPGGATWAYYGDAARELHPTNPTLILPVELRVEQGWDNQFSITDAQALEFLAIDVEDELGPVDGTITKVGRHIHWVGQAPFVSNTTVFVRIDMQNLSMNEVHGGEPFFSDDEVFLEYQITDGEAQPIRIIETRGELGDKERNICADNHRYQPAMTMEAVLDTDYASDYYSAEVTGGPGITCILPPYVRNGVVHAECSSLEVQDPFCMTVTVTSLFDGSSDSTALCIDAADSVAPDRDAEPRPDWCDGPIEPPVDPPVDPPIDDPQHDDHENNNAPTPVDNDESAAAGCQAVNGSPGAPLWPLGLVLLGLVAMRRRGQGNTDPQRR